MDNTQDQGYENTTQAPVNNDEQRHTGGDRDSYHNRRGGDREGQDRDFSYRKSGDFNKDGRRGGKFKKYDRIASKKLDIDYKKPEILKSFLTEKGKLLSRMVTGNSTQNQHELTKEVKRARYLGFLPSA